MIPEPAAIIANRPVFLSREESVRDGHVFIGYRMDRNCVKIVYGDSVFKKKKAKMKITGSIIGPAGKKINYKKKKITGSIIGPAMAGPRNFVSKLVPGSGNFQLSPLAGLGYGLGLRFWVVFTIIVSLTQTLTLITTLTVILP